MFLEKHYGHEQVKPETENFIVSIARELGITQNITIRKMNADAIVRLGWHNCFVVFNAMFVSEGFLDTLSGAEKRFIIGHELMHMKHNDSTKRLAMHMLIFAGAFGVQKYMASKHYHWSSKIGAGLAYGIATSIGALYISRQQEYAADSGSAKALGAASGGISFLSKLPQAPTTQLAYIKDILSSHPRNQDRIDRLKNL